MMSRDEIDKLKGIKEGELEKLGPCAVCKKPLFDRSGFTFYRLTLERAALDYRAIERRVGLGMIIGSSAIAAVMGPDEDLAKVFQGPRTVVVHEQCADHITHLLFLLEEEG